MRLPVPGAPSRPAVPRGKARAQGKGLCRMWTQRVNQDERDAETSIIELPVQQHGTRGLALQRQDGRPAARERRGERRTHARARDARPASACPLNLCRDLTRDRTRTRTVLYKRRNTNYRTNIDFEDETAVCNVLHGTQ